MIRSTTALAALALSTFAFVTAEALPIGLLGPIARELSVPQSAVGLLVTGYAAVVVATTIPLARVTRGVPRRLLLAVLLGILVIGSAFCAAATSYAWLLVLRLVVAVAQALFWAIVTPAAAAVVSEAAQGRAVALVNGGSALGPVLGVPAGTWVGQVAGWRSAFLLLAGLGAVALVGVLVAVPSATAADQRAAMGTEPDRVRFAATVVVTGLAVTGAYAAFTYVTPFLDTVAGLPAAADAPVLLLRGIAGFAGTVLVGFIIGRAPWGTILAVVGLQTIAFTAQGVLGQAPAIAVAAVVASGLTLAALASANGARILRYAPGDTAAASAAVSTAFNVGIMLGALLGSVTESGAGVVAVPLVGAAVSALALAVVAVEPAIARSRSIGAPVRM